MASSTPSEAIRAATFQRLHPKIYLERFLEENVRPDGRAFLEFRDCSINVGMPLKNMNSSLRLTASRWQVRYLPRMVPRLYV